MTSRERLAGRNTRSSSDGCLGVKGSPREREPPGEERALLAGVVGPRARHHEDVLARAHAVVRRSRSRRRSGSSAPPRAWPSPSSYVDSISGNATGLLAQAVELLVLAREHLPVDVLRDRHATRRVGRAVGQRLGDALEEAP